ncbi:tRNA synthetase subunit beta [Aeromonas encheleia]|nr:phenylalanine--tRNA ligase beta subunit-related protein [Aeromonas encheleia]UNP90352.1 tRNA synthetase subunit beta [Aeromonas encheleia]
MRDGELPSIDPIVDLYNAISIEYAIPVGGENLVAYEGVPRLVVADGSELFDTMKEGLPAHETPEPGEVVWRDDKGVTCRRWNWRQGVRTRLSVESEQMWFILESLPEMPLAALQEAGDRLIAGLLAMMPGARIEQELIGCQSGA